MKTLLFVISFMVILIGAETISTHVVLGLLVACIGLMVMFLIRD